MVGHKFWQLSGWKFWLDSTWFNEQNPYWWKMALMLQPLQYTNEQLKDNATSNIYNNVGMVNVMDGSVYTQIYDSSTYAQGTLGYTEDIQLAQWTQPNQRAYWYNTLPMSYTVNMVISLQLVNFGVNEVEETLKFWANTGLVVEMEHLDDNGNIVSTNKTLICDTETALNTSTYEKVIRVDEFYQSYGNSYRINIDISDIFIVNQADYGTKFGVNLKSYWILGNQQSTHNTPFYYIAGTKLYPSYKDYRSTYPMNLSGNATMSIVFSNEIRSGASYTLSRLWNFEYTPWQIILNYCKIFRLLVIIEEDRHAIHIVPAIEYFRTYNIEDWSNKLDTGRDFTIKPVYWEA